MIRTGFPPIEYCAKCRGACCKVIPGIAYPQDFDGLYRNRAGFIEATANLLETRLWVLSWYNGDPRVPEDRLDPPYTRIYFPRPATVHCDWPRDPGCCGTCVMLRDTGCILPWAERPEGCRMLEPRSHRCNAHGYNRKHAAAAWLPYQRILEAACKIAERRIQKPRPVTA